MKQDLSVRDRHLQLYGLVNSEIQKFKVTKKLSPLGPLPPIVQKQERDALLANFDYAPAHILLLLIASSPNSQQLQNRSA